MQAEKLGLKPRGGTAWSHGFLNQKDWHPLSYRNQEKLFKAEQEAENAKKRKEAAAKEFAVEQEFFKNTELLSAEDRTNLRNKQQLSFMYQKPPGYDAAMEREKAEAEEAREAERKELKRKEDAAAREAAGLPPLTEEEINERRGRRMKKDMYGRNIISEVEMPELKGAPKEKGVGVANVKVFGKHVRAVQCLRCGGFGHSNDEKTCPMFGHNPNDEFGVKLEDPLTLMRAREELTKMKKFEMKTPMTGRSPTRGGGDPNAANQQLLHDVDVQDALEGGTGTETGEGGILDSLPKAERKRLIREYKAKEKEEKRARVVAAEEFLKNHAKRERKEKKRKKDRKEKR